MRKPLLAIDALINLLLGFALLVFSPAVVRVLGVPPDTVSFYPSILGAVLVGIGLALLLDLRRGPAHPGGLGLQGAVAINLCGGLALIGWLVWGDLGLSPRGKVFLWSLSAVLLAISLIELLAGRVPHRRSGE